MTDTIDALSIIEMLTPFVYTSLILLPFVIPRMFFSKPKLQYKDVFIIFININQINLIENEKRFTKNPYGDDLLIDLDIYLENKDDYELTEVHHSDLFHRNLVTQYQFNESMHKLMNFSKVCIENQRTPFFLLYTNDPSYEIILTEYGIPNVINLQRLYGYYNPGVYFLKPSTPIDILYDTVYTMSDHLDISVDIKEHLVHLLDDWRT